MDIGRHSVPKIETEALVWHRLLVTKVFLGRSDYDNCAEDFERGQGNICLDGAFFEVSNIDLLSSS